MARTFWIALFPLLLLLMFQVGCEDDSAAPPPADDPTYEEVPAQTPPITPQGVTDTEPTVIGESSASPQPNNSIRIPSTAEEPGAASAYVVIQNAGPKDPQLLLRQLQQVLPKTQVVKQVQSPDTREIKLEVTNINDVRALANKIPFASVESIDVASRTITVDFDL